MHIRVKNKSFPTDDIWVEEYYVAEADDDCGSSWRVHEAKEEMCQYNCVGSLLHVEMNFFGQEKNDVFDPLSPLLRTHDLLGLFRYRVLLEHLESLG